jgi:hypothetical protein
MVEEKHQRPQKIISKTREVYADRSWRRMRPFAASRPRWDTLQSVRGVLLSLARLVLVVLTSLLMLPAALPGQSPQSTPAQSSSPESGTTPGSMGGNATGGTFAPVFDAEQRPITAGGFVDAGPVIFQDVTKAAGLSGWVHRMGSPEKKYIIDTDGSGVGLIDYDNDGWLDIYFVNGSTFEAMDGKQTPPHAALFHNNHDGTFSDVAAKAGVNNDRWGFGVAIGDFDNDGWADIFVAN